MVRRSPHAEPFRVHPDRPGLVWPCPIDPDGVLGPTAKQARGRRWQRSSYGFYLPTDLVGEYDGSEHLKGTQRAKDIRREGAFRRAGLEYVEMVAADRRDPSDLLRWQAA